MTFSLSNLSKQRLLTCHDDLQTLVNKLTETVPILVMVGFRDEIDQNAAFNSGHSKLRRRWSLLEEVVRIALDLEAGLPHLLSEDVIKVLGLDLHTSSAPGQGASGETQEAELKRAPRLPSV